MRKWKQETELELRAFIKQTKGEYWWVLHVKNCEMCLLEVQLGVERYHGTRLPWFLNIQNEISFGPEEEFDDDGEFAPHLKDMPRVWDYEIGNYWARTEGRAMPFIKARLAWAEKKLISDLDCAVTALVFLERWRLNWYTSEEEVNAVILHVSSLESQISPLFYFLG